MKSLNLLTMLELPFVVVIAIAAGVILSLAVIIKILYSLVLLIVYTIKGSKRLKPAVC